MDLFKEDILVSFFCFRPHVFAVFTFTVMSVFSVVAELKDDSVHKTYVVNRSYRVILLTATVIHFCLYWWFLIDRCDCRVSCGGGKETGTSMAPEPLLRTLLERTVGVGRAALGNPEVWYTQHLCFFFLADYFRANSDDILHIKVADTTSVGIYRGLCRVSEITPAGQIPWGLSGKALLVV